jgi:hypothetical protein
VPYPLRGVAHADSTCSSGEGPLSWQPQSWHDTVTSPPHW